MNRNTYTVFSPAKIAGLTLPNRIVRSATNEGLHLSGRVTDTVVDLYRQLAAGGTGLIITGDIPVAEWAADNGAQGKIPAGSGSPADNGIPAGASAKSSALQPAIIDGLDRLVETVHRSGSGARIIAQIGANGLGRSASVYPTPFAQRRFSPVSIPEISAIVDCFVRTIVRLQQQGFDGVQLHGAHGYFLCSFLSPFLNRRRDAYGGSVENRVRIIGEIVTRAREKVGAFPILIKINCTDHMPAEKAETFVHTMAAIEGAGIDAVEISGGIIEAITRSEAELGFPPVLNTPSRTAIQTPEKQSYFLNYAQMLSLNIPIILVGGNRDVEQLEGIVRGGKVDFVALSRPLIHEPRLPRRWREGRGPSGAACISCNSCFYPLYNPETYSGPRCLYREDKDKHREAQRWLAGWLKSAIGG